MFLLAPSAYIPRHAVEALIVPAVAMGVAVGAVAQPAAAAQLRGLVVGINEYPQLAERFQLGGAVNDARDIADTLRRSGSRDVMLMLDRQVTKEALENAWSDLVERSAPGDTIVFSFAGHGSQEDEPPGRGGEADGKNENFLLSGYSPQAPHNAQRVVDDEVNAWLKQADDKDVNVVFIADSCHSGTMFRALDTQVRYRNVTLPEITDDQVELPPLDAAPEEPADFRNVTFVSATVENKQIPEVQIDSEWRGALSYSFARALEDEGADADNDGDITQAELVNYLLTKVQSIVEGQQQPQVLPVRAASRPIVTRSRNVEQKPPPLGVDLLKVAVKNGSAGLLGSIANAVHEPEPAKADLVWDVSAGTMENVPGGRAAENVDQTTLHTVMSKWTTIKWLKTHARKRPARLILRSGEQRYGPGDTIELVFEGAELPHLTLFNLAPNGRVEFMLNDNEVQKDWRGVQESWRFQLGEPPYGSEHMVAILTEKPLADLHRKLKAMKTADMAIGLRDLVIAALEDKPFQFAIKGIYTGAES